MVEHLLCKQTVVGSNPVASTNPGAALELVEVSEQWRAPLEAARSLRTR